MKKDDNPSIPPKGSQPKVNPQPLAQPQHTISARESRAAINQVIASAQKVIRIFDHDLSDPGYSDPARIEFLESFLLKSRRNQVQVVVHEARHLDRDCARLMALFRRHADVFAIRCTVDAAKNAADALVIADEHSYWHKLHHDQPRVTFGIDDRAGTGPLLNRFNEIWDSSEPAIGASVLGL